MPTQRFFNLKEEKRKAIVEAAVHEFSRVPYSAASINQIIKEADISRGSFYTYFEDKDDLMRYLIRDFREMCREKVYSGLEASGGDPFEAACSLLGQVMSYGGCLRGVKMYRSALTDLNIISQNQLFGMEGFLYKDEIYTKYIHQLYIRLDRSRFPVRDEKKLACLVEMMQVMIVKAISMFYMGLADPDTLMAVTRDQMDILKNGAFPRPILCGRLSDEEKEKNYEKQQ